MDGWMDVDGCVVAGKFWWETCAMTGYGWVDLFFWFFFSSSSSSSSSSLLLMLRLYVQYVRRVAGESGWVRCRQEERGASGTSGRRASTCWRQPSSSPPLHLSSSPPLLLSSYHSCPLPGHYHHCPGSLESKERKNEKKNIANPPPPPRKKKARSAGKSHSPRPTRPPSTIFRAG